MDKKTEVAILAILKLFCTIIWCLTILGPMAVSVKLEKMGFSSLIAVPIGILAPAIGTTILELILGIGLGRRK